MRRRRETVGPRISRDNFGRQAQCEAVGHADLYWTSPRRRIRQRAPGRASIQLQIAKGMLLAAALLTLALADCDDIVGAASGDLFLACHSPSDKFTVPVVGQKAANDEM